MNSSTPSPWKVYATAAIIAAIAGGLVGSDALIVPMAMAESPLRSGPGALDRQQEQEIDPVSAPPRMLKIGFVNSQAIFDMHPRVPELRSALENQLRQWQQEQVDLQGRAQTLQNELRTAQLSPGQRRSKEAELQDVMSQVARYQTEIWSPGGRAEQKEKELMQPIIQAIDQTIREIAEGAGFDLILDAGSGGLLFGHRSLDLTRPVLERLGIPIPSETPPPPADR